MMHQHHVYLRARRTVAAVACTVFVALGVSTVTASAAGAADAPDLAVAWQPQVLTYDANGNGRPDLGDEVTLTAAFTAGARDTTVLTVSNGLRLFWAPATLVPAGTTVTLSHAFTVNQLHLTDAGGSGPVFGNITVSHWRSRTFVPTSITVPPPAVLYTAPAPLDVVSAFDLSEVGGPVDGVLREGDTVGYHSTLTNTTGKVMTITSLPGYEDFPGTATLQPGESQTYTHNPVTVTYAAMVAGSIAFPDAAITWSARFDAPLAQTFTGTYTASYGSVPTEAVDASFDAAVAFKVHSHVDGSRVPLGDAVEGDVIDFKVDVTNAGNVTMNYVGINLGSAWGPAATLSFKDNSQLTPGAALPNGVWAGRDLKSGGNGVFAPYTLTAADVARGYVDLSVDVQVAPSLAVFEGDAASHTATVSERVFLRKFTTGARLVTKSELIDTNGDGIGQAGETVEYLVRFVNNANQDLTIDALTDLAGSHVAGEAASKFVGAVVVQDDKIAKRWIYTITPADEARGAIDYGVQADYTGSINWKSDTRSAWSDTVVTAPYVAPASTLNTSATYVDSNADGFPSIGETVTVTVTVANVGTYALTGLTVTDAPTADVAGLLPAFPTSLPAGGTSTKTFDYVLTAADFTRGSLWYSTDMTADGLPTTASGTSVTLTGITFQAYSTDLDEVPAGGIDVCLPTAVPTDTITRLENIWVKPEACGFIGSAEGYRVVAFSTPVTMGADTFAVTVPVALTVGAHRLALYAPDGSLVGWKAVTVKDPIGFAGPGGAALAFTGTDSQELSGIAGGAAALVLLGSASVFAAVRRRRISEGE